jgi:hypothetical protein
VLLSNTCLSSRIFEMLKPYDHGRASFVVIHNKQRFIKEAVLAA